MSADGEVNEVWENQRYYGIGWGAPGLLERSAWSDEDGNPVALGRPPSESRHLGWRLAASTATSPDGWQYASVFKHFEYMRPGGRASARATDLVRRRCWRRSSAPSGALTAAAARAAGRPGTGEKPRPAQFEEGDEELAAVGGGDSAAAAEADADQEADGDEAKVVSLVSPATEMDGHRKRRETEADRRRTVLKLFMGMISATIKRWQVWNLMPLDPVAWLVMYNEHRAALTELIAANMHKRLPLEAVRDAQPQQHVAAKDAGLVRELLAAAMHSRAAYGYAMQAGHLTSVMNFALLHTVHSFSFDAAGGASGDANNEAVAALAGVRAEDIIMAEWHNSIGRPCHYVAVDRANHSIVLSIRGSLEAGDVFSDISASPLEMRFMGTTGSIHEGLMAAATYVHSNTAGALVAAGHDFPGWPLFLTGHSMGGAVASLVTLLLDEHGLPEGLGQPRCFAIGPAAVMSADLAEAAAPLITSVCLRSDFVPRLTYAGVEGLLLELADCSPVRRAAKGVGKKMSAALESLKVGWGGGGGGRGSPCTSQPPSPKGLEGIADLAEGSKGVAEAAAQSAAEKARRSVAAAAASAGAHVPAEASGCSADSAGGADGSAEVSSRPTVANAAKVRRTGSPDSSSSPRREAQQQVAGGCPCGSPAASPTAAAATSCVGGRHNAAAGDKQGHSEPPGAAALPRVESAAEYVLSHSSEAGGNAIDSGGGGRNSHAAGSMAAHPSARPEADGSAPGCVAAAGQPQGDGSPKAGHGQQDGSTEGAIPSAREAPDDIQGAAEGGARRAQRASFEERATAAEVLPGDRSGADRPEMLYPAGRVLWLIPQDEPAVVADDAAADEEGLFQSGGALPRVHHNVVSPSSPSGGSGSGRSGSPAGSPAAKSSAPVQNVAGIAASVTGVSHAAPGKAPPGRITGFGGGGGGGFGPEPSSPDAGAAAAKGAAQKQWQGGGDPGTGGNLAPGKAPSPAVLDVDRRVFSRILVSPDVMADHLPDSYLAHIQQL